MLLLSLPYFLVALYLGGTAFWNGEIALGFAMIGASYLALGAGVSVRKLLKRDFRNEFDARKQALLMVLLAALMLVTSIALMHYFDITVGSISGIVFSLMGVGIGCLSDMSSDAKVETLEPSDG